MIELTPDESRVIGVLIEKDLTTPESYPLTLNQVVNGANQKTNRDPVCDIDDNAARSALIGLRNKGLVVQLDGHGQRTSKFRHEFMTGAAVNKPEMVVLAELLLRGPQTLGELRGHCSRMMNFESLEMVKNTLAQLMGRPEPMVRQVPPDPGSRAERYVQLLCPDLHPLAAPTTAAGVAGAMEGEAGPGTAGIGLGGGPGIGAGAQQTLAQRVSRLEAEVAALKAAFTRLAAQLGAEDPFGGAGGGGRGMQDEG